MENSELIVVCDNIEIFEDDVEMAIKEACLEFCIDDLVAVGQRRWKSVLRYVGKCLFPDNKILRDKKTVWIEGNKIPTNNNKFDYEIIDTLCNYYMALSDRYNKLISAEAFSLFLNIPRDTIGSWKDDEKSSSARFHIYKKIKDFRLECIKDNAYDNGNVTGTMYVGNVEYQTNLPGVSRETSKNDALTASELPKLGGQNIQIAQNDSD